MNAAHGSLLATIHCSVCPIIISLGDITTTHSYRFLGVLHRYMVSFNQT